MLHLFCRVLTAVIFGAIAVGQNSSFAPDYAEAKTSAKRMFKLIDQTPQIDAYSDEGLQPVSMLLLLLFTGSVQGYYLNFALVGVKLLSPPMVNLAVVMHLHL